MPPKKKTDKKPDTEEPTGPSIYKELLTKQIPELTIDLTAPISVLLQENVEFEILVDRIELQCMRIEKDNQRLQRIDSKIQTALESALGIKEFHQQKSVKDRKEISKQKSELQEELLKVQETRTEMQKQLLKEKEKLVAQNEIILSRLSEDILKNQQTLEELKEYQRRAKEYREEKDLWTRKRDQQRENHAKFVEEIEHDKVVQIDNLRKEMLMQIREVKIQMLNMNEDQLVGTTKLTVIQNASLTGELEYQSKQTEHQMYKNQQMHTIIKQLTQDLADHQQVENELAKRSHFCQKVIKKYKLQVQQLKADIAQKEQEMYQNHQSVSKDEQDLQNYLNNRIGTYDTKLKQTQQYLKAQETEYQELLSKVFSFKQRYSKMALLLTEFVETIVEQDPGILDKQQDIYLNIDEIKSAESMRDVAPESLVALCLVLLKQLQPFISELQNTKHLDQYQQRFACVPEIKHFDQQPNILLVAKEDERKLQFMKEQQTDQPYRYQTNMPAKTNSTLDSHRTKTQGVTQMDSFVADHNISPPKKFMTLRAGQNKVGKSLDRVIGTIGAYAQSKSKLSLQYNSSSIPYIQRRVPHSVLQQKYPQQHKMPEIYNSLQVNARLANVNRSVLV